MHVIHKKDIKMNKDTLYIDMANIFYKDIALLQFKMKVQKY